MEYWTLIEDTAVIEGCFLVIVDLVGLNSTGEMDRKQGGSLKA